MSPTTILLIVLGVVLLWLVMAYNRLVILRNRAKEGFSDIDVQLKRRYDLIPNLIEAVKGYAAHEKGVLEQVTEARTRALSAEQSGNVKDMGMAENMLAGAMKSLFAVAENYPDLKASANFVELQRELRDAEDKIQAARRFYNTTVMALNSSIESFPTNLVAGTLGFLKQDFFEIASPQERETPRVNF
ncbi:MAG: LemA family protein [bacterium]|nr:LemA family protein [bacterium]